MCHPRLFFWSLTTSVLKKNETTLILAEFIVYFPVVYCGHILVSIHITPLYPIRLLQYSSNDLTGQYLELIFSLAQYTESFLKHDPDFLSTFLLVHSLYFLGVYSWWSCDISGCFPSLWFYYTVDCSVTAIKLKTQIPFSFRQ